MAEWFARPVLHVASVEAALRFYVAKLGFTAGWRYEEDGRARVAQVDRLGCALILSDQWPDKVGKGLMFISLDGAADVDALRAELETRNVAVREQQWGYRVLAVDDPDGNQLFFPYPNDPS